MFFCVKSFTRDFIAVDSKKCFEGNVGKYNKTNKSMSFTMTVLVKLSVRLFAVRYIKGFLFVEKPQKESEYLA